MNIRMMVWTIGIGLLGFGILVASAAGATQLIILPQFVGCADLNNDGLLDLVFSVSIRQSDQGQSLYAMIQEGGESGDTGTPDYRVAILRDGPHFYSLSVPREQIRRLLLRDVDGDSRADLVWRDDTGGDRCQYNLCEQDRDYYFSEPIALNNRNEASATAIEIPPSSLSTELAAMRGPLVNDTQYEVLKDIVSVFGRLPDDYRNTVFKSSYYWYLASHMRFSVVVSKDRWFHPGLEETSGPHTINPFWLPGDSYNAAIAYLVSQGHRELLTRTRPSRRVVIYDTSRTSEIWKRFKDYQVEFSQ